MAQADESGTNNTSHPERVLLAVAHREEHEQGSSIDRRRALLEGAGRLAGQGGDSEQKLAGQMLAAAVEPGGDYSSADPIEGRTVRFGRYVEGPTDLRRVAEELWPLVASQAPSLVARGRYEILEGLSEWQRAAASEDLDLPAESRRLITRFLATAMSDLRDSCADPPMLAVRWNGRAERISSTAAPLPVPETFRALLPLHERVRGSDVDLDEARRRLDASRDQAVERLRDHGVAQAVERLAEWVRSAAQLEVRLDAGVVLALLPVAGHVTDALLDALDREPLAGHRGPLMARALREEPERWEEWWPDEVERSHKRWEMVAGVLDADDAPHDLLREAASRLRAEDAWRLDRLFLAKATPGGPLDLLLDHPAPEIRGAAAVAFAVGDDDHGPRVPDAWQDRWDGAFLDATTVVGQHQTWRLERTFEALAEERPNHAEAWLTRLLEDEDDSLRVGEYVKWVGALPIAHRVRLLETTREHLLRAWLVEGAVDGDPSGAVELLRVGALDAGEVAAQISNERRGEWFETVAPVLIDAGVDPGRLARSLQTGGWTGEKSDHARELAIYCEDLSSSEDDRLVQIGQAGHEYFKTQAEEAAERERRERVRGLGR